MSKALGLAQFKDGTVMLFKFNGTKGIALPKLFKTKQDYDNNEEGVRKIKCNHITLEEVNLFTEYAKGRYWVGKACRVCGTIVDRMGFSEEDFINGDYFIDDTPDWAKTVMENILKKGR